ncbi:hypothetical protein FJ414_23400 [Mesorhizobium sp. B3-1-6]|uniref:hypothetical protein n=1 Tax=Mesorhizobium sp. B3-1-6 TaxID=2589895 RepID=UPI00112A7F30|nr:hypothetical protein [Mesorhizobium sp. B3-1-6]TPI31507.1 hypothetical protein FJ414_23400 [Mesorhizobium sp. B3-1-6]
MTDCVVEEMNGMGVLRRHQVDATSAIQAAGQATGRAIGSGRNPGTLWIRVKDVAKKIEHEFHFAD